MSKGSRPVKITLCARDGTAAYDVVRADSERLQAGEHIEWIRGWWPDGSAERDALLAAAALGDAPPETGGVTGQCVRVQAALFPGGVGYSTHRFSVAGCVAGPTTIALSDEGATWCRGRVTEKDDAGKALLAAHALAPDRAIGLTENADLYKSGVIDLDEFRASLDRWDNALTWKKRKTQKGHDER